MLRIIMMMHFKQVAVEKKKCHNHLLADYSFGIAQPISVDERDLRNYAYYMSALH